MTTLILVACALVAIADGVSIHLGLVDIMGASGKTTFLALIMACAATVGLFGLWHRSVHLVPTFASEKAQSLGHLLMAALLATTFAVSSWFVAATLGGDTAVGTGMHKATVLVAENTAVAQQNVEMIHQKLRAKVSELEVIARAHENKERAGDLSGIPGSGERWRAYQAMAQSAMETGAAMDEQYARATTIIVAINDLISELNRIASELKKKSLAERQELFLERVAALRELVKELQQYEELAAAEAISPVTLITWDVSSTGDDTRKRVEMMHGSFTEEVQRVRKALQRVPEITFEPMNRATAVVRYAGSVPGAWAVGAAIDCLPILGILLLSIGFVELRSRKRQDRRATKSQQKSADRRAKAARKEELRLLHAMDLYAARQTLNESPNANGTTSEVSANRLQD